MAPTATQVATVTKDFAQPHNLVDALPEPHKVKGDAHANHKETQEQGVEKTPNPQGGNYATTLRTRALGFSIFFLKFVVVGFHKHHKGYLY